MKFEILKDSWSESNQAQVAVIHLLSLIYFSTMAKSMCIFLHREDSWQLKFENEVPVSVIDCSPETEMKHFVRVTQVAVNEGCAVSSNLLRLWFPPPSWLFLSFL